MSLSPYSGSRPFGGSSMRPGGSSSYSYRSYYKSGNSGFQPAYDQGFGQSSYKQSSYASSGKPGFDQAYNQTYNQAYNAPVMEPVFPAPSAAPYTAPYAGPYGGASSMPAATQTGTSFREMAPTQSSTTPLTSTQTPINVSHDYGAMQDQYYGGQHQQQQFQQQQQQQQQYMPMQQQQQPFMGGQSAGPYNSQMSSTVTETALSAQQSTSHHKSKVTDHIDHYMIAMEAPGLMARDVRIRLMPDRILKISGEYFVEHATEVGAGARRIERTHRTFSKSFSLPSGADLSNLTSYLEHGTVYVRIGKIMMLGAGQERGSSIPVYNRY